MSGKFHTFAKSLGHQLTFLQCRAGGEGPGGRPGDGGGGAPGHGAPHDERRHHEQLGRSRKFS